MIIIKSLVSLHYHPFDAIYLIHPLTPTSFPFVNYQSVSMTVSFYLLCFIIFWHLNEIIQYLSFTFQLNSLNLIPSNTTMLSQIVRFKFLMSFLPGMPFVTNFQMCVFTFSAEFSTNASTKSSLMLIILLSKLSAEFKVTDFNSCQHLFNLEWVST